MFLSSPIVVLIGRPYIPRRNPAHHWTSSRRLARCRDRWAVHLADFLFCALLRTVCQVQPTVLTTPLFHFKSSEFYYVRREEEKGKWWGFPPENGKPIFRICNGKRPFIKPPVGLVALWWGRHSFRIAPLFVVTCGCEKRGTSTLVPAASPAMFTTSSSRCWRMLSGRQRWTMLPLPTSCLPFVWGSLRCGMVHTVTLNVV